MTGDVEDLDQLIRELTDISKAMSQVQDTNAISDSTVQVTVDRYYEWFARALAALPEDLTAPFRDAYEGGNWTNKIKAFVSDPRAANVMFDPSKPDNPLAAAPFQHSYQGQFRPYAEAQRQILIEAKHRPMTGPASTRSGPIFLVHGHDEARLHDVARLLQNATDRDVTVLREQPNHGKTILEKFEEQAVTCSYAVVLLTGDDLGRSSSTEVDQPRARQNVVLLGTVCPSRAPTDATIPAGLRGCGDRKRRAGRAGPRQPDSCMMPSAQKVPFRSRSIAMVPPRRVEGQTGSWLTLDMGCIKVHNGFGETCSHTSAKSRLPRL